MSSILRFDEWQDSNGVSLLDGSGGSLTIPSGFLPSSSILQFVSTTVTTQFTTNSGTYQDVTDMTLSITPSSASNKIFVFFDSQLAGSGYFGTARILRNDNPIGGGSVGYGMIPATPYGETDSSIFAFLDSPDSTSLQTYKLQIALDVAGGGRDVTCNRRHSSTSPAVSSRITLLEVAA